ncbi:MAG: S-methyl-5-thioribose-1-phosphate isomerase [Chloroflexi bacterium]|nr:S-methyl-5-thioribose-1-phosphate isomerase [Chloroflexota bacterium]
MRVALWNRNRDRHVRTIYREGQVVKLIDQTRLPLELVIVECTEAGELCEAIRTMRIRGAPALGVAAAYAFALGAEEAGGDAQAVLAHLDEVAALVRRTRPTAVNLFWGVERALAEARSAAANGPLALRAALWELADRLADEDVALNQRLGANGAALISEGARILTHCNAGSLATVGWGTALGVVRTAHRAGRRLHVFVDETRPFLQGARLTAWELEQEGVPYTIITDSTAGHLMARGEIDLCLVGADRIAASGDVANKIGTYTLSVLANAHRLPFYVAAPTSTIDLSTETGAEIPIEERDSSEVLSFAGVRVAPSGARARNPAFDVTPSRFVTAIITEVGVHSAPYEITLEEAVRAGPHPLPPDPDRHAGSPP